MKLKHKRLAILTVMALMMVGAKGLRAEEIQPLEISPDVPKMMIEAPQKTEAQPSQLSSHAPGNPLGLRVTPLYGFIGSADGNQRLWNKYSAGINAEISLSPNLSIEGVFRYALFDIRQNVPANLGAVYPALAANSGAVLSSNTPTANSIPLGDMRQIVVGGNLKYELFPHSILTPFIGGGVSYFDNEYITTDNPVVRVTFPQAVYAGSALAGMKLKLSQEVAIVGRGEVGSLLNNHNGAQVWGSQGAGASIHPSYSFKTFDKYWTMMAGISFGM